MENVHTLDSEMLESLKDMFNSSDNDSVKIALSILNNVNFNDENVVQIFNELTNECTGLHFALFQNKKGDIRARFSYVHYHLNKPFMVDDESTLDNDEWVAYEPDIKLDKHINHIVTSINKLI